MATTAAVIASKVAARAIERDEAKLECTWCAWWSTSAYRSNIYVYFLISSSVPTWSTRRPFFGVPVPFYLVCFFVYLVLREVFVLLPSITLSRSHTIRQSSVRENVLWAENSLLLILFTYKGGRHRASLPPKANDANDIPFHCSGMRITSTSKARQCSLISDLNTRWSIINRVVRRKQNSVIRSRYMLYSEWIGEASIVCSTRACCARQRCPNDWYLSELSKRFSPLNQYVYRL